MTQGIVIKSTGSWYTVKTDDGAEIDCKVKGRFRLQGIRSTNPVSVGDRVHITVADDGAAFITRVDDRRNYIIRRASNLSKESHRSFQQAFLKREYQDRLYVFFLL